MAERRALKMHPKLLLDVIKRQAGTIQKAVLEGVMNSIEAKGGEVAVTIEPRKVTIVDNGKGFQNAQEIENWFETFGQPHDESEGKKWAQFRMGRGQMFAFGRNVWRTGKFRMLVDVNSWGKCEASSDLTYELQSNLPDEKGCSIEIDLYEPISDREISGIVREIETYVKYVDIPVSVNGLQVNKDPAHEQWGRESNDAAYIKLTAGSRGLDVYNLGVFVRHYAEWEFGTSGVVVSKKKLDVNFARNDVIKSCKVWREIRDVIDKSDRVKKIKTKAVLSEGERLSLIDKLGAGELTEHEAKNAKLFVDASGHAWSAKTIGNAGFVSWTVAPKRDRRADRLLQRKTCLALDEDIVNEFNCKPHELFEKQWKFTDVGCSIKLLGWKHKLPYADFEEAVKGIESRNDILHESKWRERERIWLRIANRMQHELHYHYSNGLDNPLRSMPLRKLTVGQSETADGWTDGATYVAIRRKFMEKYSYTQDDRPDISGLHAMMILLVHELCHDNNSEDADHGAEFYKAFHDIMRYQSHGVLKTIYNWLTPKKLDALKQQAISEGNGAKRRADALERAKEKVAKTKAKTKKKPEETPKKVAASTAPKPKDKGPTAKELTSEQIKQVVKERDSGAPWAAIEKKLGLREAKGMTAVRAYKLGTA